MLFSPPYNSNWQLSRSLHSPISVRYRSASDRSTTLVAWTHGPTVALGGVYLPSVVGVCYGVLAVVSVPLWNVVIDCTRLSLIKTRIEAEYRFYSLHSDEVHIVRYTFNAHNVVLFRNVPDDEHDKFTS